MFDERVEIADRGDHEAARRPVDLHVVSQAVGHPRGVVAVQHCGALAVEVHGGFVGVEFIEYRCESSPPPNLLGRGRISTVHIHEKIRVLGEQCHLTGSVASIGAKRVRVDKFADRQPVGYFPNGKLGVVAAGEICRRQGSFPSLGRDSLEPLIPMRPRCTRTQRVSRPRRYW